MCCVLHGGLEKRTWGVAKLTQKEKGGHPSLICGTILAGVDPSRREGRGSERE